MDRKSNEPPADRFPRRTAAAAVTRAALVRAAGELYAANGYAETTVTAIAARAGVGRATVFTSVPGGKPELLKLARDEALAGDDEPVPLPQRGWFLEAMAAEDPSEVVRLQARNYRMIQERAAVLERCLVVGAATAPELAALLTEARQQRARGARLVVDRLAELSALAPRDVRRATDALYALASPDVYLLLVADRRWTPTQYERWLAAAISSVVLGATAS